MSRHLWVFNELFSKFGMGDGDAPFADDVHALFSEYLERRGFENHRISSIHNERVVEIRVGERWFQTWGLTWGPPWRLVDDETEEEVAAPRALERVLLEFARRAAALIEAARAGIPPRELETVRRFALDGRPRAVEVSAATAGAWYVVSRARPFGVGSRAWTGKPGRRGMKERAERLLRAALQNRRDGAAPRVTFIFTTGVSVEVAAALREMGVEVTGEVIERRGVKERIAAWWRGGASGA